MGNGAYKFQDGNKTIYQLDNGENKPKCCKRHMQLYGLLETSQEYDGGRGSSGAGSRSSPGRGTLCCVLGTKTQS